MAQTKINPIFRLMPSLTDVAFLLPIVFLFSRMEGMRTLLADGDTGWHIRTGEWILAHHQIPHQDIFSFTMPNGPWYAWEWLWDVGAAVLFQHWGLGAVALASLFIICLTFALLFRVVNRACGNPLIAIGLAVLAASGSTIHWLARPHLVTMLFTAVFVAILQRVREGRVKLLWWLPVLTIVWTNLHGGFLVGIVILGAYGAGELVRAVLAAASAERRAAFRSALPYLAAAAGCAAASLINPYGYQLHKHIVEYFQDPYLLKYIAEFQSSSFHESASAFLEAMLVFGLGAAVWCGMRKRFGEAILLVGWAHLALVSERNIPIFMIVAAPVTAMAMVEWMEALRKAVVVRWLPWVAEQFESIAEEIAPMERLWRTHAISAAALVVIGLAISSPAAGPLLKPEFNPKSFPAGALAMLNASQRIFTSDQWGDYLIYRLSPQGVKVFVDGRSDFYGAKFGQDYIDVMNVKYDWKETLEKYGVDTILLSVDSALAGAVKESGSWRVVYDDGLTIVCQRTADAHKASDFNSALEGISPLAGPRAQHAGFAANKLPSAATMEEERDRKVTEPHVIAQRITVNKKL